MDDADRILFHTDDGREVPAVSVEEMREIDRVAVDETGPSLLQMMENAGSELAACALDMLDARGGWRGRRVVVLAGSGGNGGGGICAARHLANRGVRTLVALTRALDQLEGAPAVQLRILREAPAEVIPWSDAFDISEADLVIDAVVGYSLRDVPVGPVMALIRAAGAGDAPVLSLDVPSGLDPDTGNAPGAVVQPTRTLTLALPKLGLRRETAGELWLADLGIPPGVYARAGLAFTPIFDERSRLPLQYPGEAARA